MQSDRASTLHGLLALVAASELIDGRVRLQKEAYFLGLKGYKRFSPKKFTFYYYGPYSRDVSDALHYAVTSDLIAEIKEPYNGKIKYSYRLSDKGLKWVESESDDQDGIVVENVRLLSEAHWRTLELAASAVFLERTSAVVNREQAFAKALDLKPECRDYYAPANELLDRLQL